MLDIEAIKVRLNLTFYTFLFYFSPTLVSVCRSVLEDNVHIFLLRIWRLLRILEWCDWNLFQNWYQKEKVEFKCLFYVLVSVMNSVSMAFIQTL
jgi:hypothetical protein